MSPLQEKYNDWCDAGKHPVNFYAQNNILGNKYEELCRELEDRYQKLEEDRKNNPQERLKIIRKRIKNYRQHEDDPYVFYPSEVDFIRVFLEHAPDDIEFLINKIEELEGG